MTEAIALDDVAIFLAVTEYFNAVTFAQFIGNHSDDDHSKFEEAC